MVAEQVTTTNWNVTADDESDEKLCITFGTQPRQREKTDTKVNTELCAVVNHVAKLNDSSDVKAMTDREKTRG